jgi:hypothetical protein
MWDNWRYVSEFTQMEISKIEIVAMNVEWRKKT